MYSSEEMVLFNNINKKLKIDEIRNIIFVYTAPKVGSTSLVSSLRIFLPSESYKILHVHDEVMFRYITGIENVSINQIIEFNACFGKNVFVIDIYRTPIERKISEFFDKLCSLHFNNSEDQIIGYKMNRIIKRFNNLFHHIGEGDHFFEKYNIPSNIVQMFSEFDFDKKHIYYENENINYIKLRLSDSHLWGTILSSIFGVEVFIVKDYETKDKKLGGLYDRFKKEYKIPRAYLDKIKESRCFNYYNSPEERESYIKKWEEKCINSSESELETKGYTKEQYQLYLEISFENEYMEKIEYEHYKDEGCVCKMCSYKRTQLKKKIIMNQDVSGEKVIHALLLKELNERNAKIQSQTNISSLNRNKIKGTISTLICANSNK